VSSKTTYALLIYQTGAEPPSPENVERALVGHRALQAEASSLGELHAVARLGERVGATTVAKQGSAHDVTDGPYAETKEWLVGFYLVDCEDEQQAVERAKTICAIEDHVVEVRPVTWRWES